MTDNGKYVEIHHFYCGIAIVAIEGKKRKKKQ